MNKQFQQGIATAEAGHVHRPEGDRGEALHSISWIDYKSQLPESERSKIIVTERVASREYKKHYMAWRRTTARGKKSDSENARTYYFRNTEECKTRNRAHKAVFVAIKKGLLTRPLTCSKCDLTGYIEAHHANYSRLLDVVWLCRTCHKNLHIEAVQPTLSEAGHGAVMQPYTEPAPAYTL